MINKTKKTLTNVPSKELYEHLQKDKKLPPILAFNKQKKLTNNKLIIPKILWKKKK